MKLHVELHVKFRVNLVFTQVTLGNVDVVKDIPLPEIPSLVPTRDLVQISERGVSLVVALLAA